MLLRPPSQKLTRMQSDFLSLTLFVLAQHSCLKELDALAAALSLVGKRNAQVVAAQMLVRFLNKNWGQALELLEELDRIAPIEQFGEYRQTDSQRMRKYLRARCLHELGDKIRTKNAIDSYLRHGKKLTLDPE